MALSSGLSWLAWAAGTPVVMISAFTQPTNEFNTPQLLSPQHWHQRRLSAPETADAAETQLIKVVGNMLGKRDTRQQA